MAHVKMGLAGVYIFMYTTHRNGWTYRHEYDHLIHGFSVIDIKILNTTKCG